MRRGWAALCREAGHDTAMPVHTHGHDTAGWAATIRRLELGARGRLSERACGASRRWRWGAGRWGAGRWGAGGSSLGVRQGCWDTATGACDTADPFPRHGRGPGHDTAAMRAPGRASGHLGVPAGPAGCLCILWFFELVFYSVIFLSHRLDPIHEHCSCTLFIIKIFDFFFKKNQIKSNKFDEIFEK